MRTFGLLFLVVLAIILCYMVCFSEAQFPGFFRPTFYRRRGNFGGHHTRESDYDFRERNRQYGYAAILGWKLLTGSTNYMYFVFLMWYLLVLYYNEWLRIECLYENYKSIYALLCLNEIKYKKCTSHSLKDMYIFVCIY